MSRRITIATKLDREDLIEKSLEELEASFSRSGSWFDISAAEGNNFRHTGARINPETQEVSYDSDDRSAKSFVQDRLPQIYNRELFLSNMMTEGHEIDNTFEAGASTYIEGFDGVIEEGDIVIESKASF